jgi:hypothetical protein
MSQAVPEFKPNLEKLKKLQQQASSVVIGGKVNLFLNFSKNKWQIAMS